MATTVIHVKKADWDAGDVYIGRAVPVWNLRRSIWANAFTIGDDGNRAEVIEMYRRWIVTQDWAMARLHELRGKRLACWCRPRWSCHGDVLAELADALPVAAGSGEA